MSLSAPQRLPLWSTCLPSPPQIIILLREALHAVVAAQAKACGPGGPTAFGCAGSVRDRAGPNGPAHASAGNDG